MFAIWPPCGAYVAKTFVLVAIRILIETVYREFVNILGVTVPIYHVIVYCNCHLKCSGIWVLVVSVLHPLIALFIPYFPEIG